MAWGGEKEQQAERDEGNLNAKNWQDEARKVLENTLPATSSCTSEAVPPQGSTSILSDFDRYREARLQEVDEEDEEGWEAEMRRYLKVVARNIMKESDIVEWWQDNAGRFPTLSRIALDVLPVRASSVPCERLFSASKQTADDRRSRLGDAKFEELQVMKFAWRRNIPNLAAWNSLDMEDVTDLDKCEHLLQNDDWEKDLDNLDQEGHLVDSDID
ncbi:hypothetical protein M378DRAFT_90389 [Amanita muscaria Koide BX008]|uniref:HAT C-terminal dimerisation domain-containing protein n=1 Tax=Amanita muscaria (strain Koide BX008) TaxID=946122 RepID=A0A0C2W3R0_AMAMK|nr:hypothetical protein M378DRAFT_90389 [Amanita muscaria Koide BX008]